MFKRIGRAGACEKHSLRQQGQGRLSGSIGYLLSDLKATTMNILVHKKSNSGMNCLRLLYLIFQGQGVAQYLQFSACASADQAVDR